MARLDPSDEALFALWRCGEPKTKLPGAATASAAVLARTSVMIKPKDDPPTRRLLKCILIPPSES
ncbi:MAG: hypothetical protein HC923_04645 [Myxococcales bacterium]|nr:hypothetical protein [Myxococcales bacterium]